MSKSPEPIVKVIAKMTAVLPDEYAAQLDNQERRIRWFESLGDIVAFTFPELTPNADDVPPDRRQSIHLAQSDKHYDISVIQPSPDK